MFCLVSVAFCIGMLQMNVNNTQAMYPKMHTVDYGISACLDAYCQMNASNFFNNL
jgi:hypothetical protein